MDEDQDQQRRCPLHPCARVLAGITRAGAVVFKKKIQRVVNTCSTSSRTAARQKLLHSVRSYQPVSREQTIVPAWHKSAATMPSPKNRVPFFQPHKAPHEMSDRMHGRIFLRKFFTSIVRARQRKVKHSACGTQKSDILYPVMRFEGCGEITRSAGCGAFYGSPFVSVSARVRTCSRCNFGRRQGRGISLAAAAECALRYAWRVCCGKSMDRCGRDRFADCDCRAAVSKRILDMVYPPASERYQPVSGFDFRCLCRSVPVWATCRKTKTLRKCCNCLRRYGIRFFPLLAAAAALLVCGIRRMRPLQTVCRFFCRPLCEAARKMDKKPPAQNLARAASKEVGEC